MRKLGQNITLATIILPYTLQVFALSRIVREFDNTAVLRVAMGYAIALTTHST